MLFLLESIGLITSADFLSVSACSGPATIVNRSKMQSLRVVFYHASGSTSQYLSGTPANSTTSVWSWS